MLGCALICKQNMMPYRKIENIWIINDRQTSDLERNSMAPIDWNATCVCDNIFPENRVNQTFNETDIVYYSDRDNHVHAFVYIIVVLLFYSIGIVIAIVSYISKERRDAEEERAYETYFAFKNESGNRKKYYRVQKVISHLKSIDRVDSISSFSSFQTKELEDSFAGSSFRSKSEFW